MMFYVPSFCVSTLQSTQFMSIPFRGLFNFKNAHNFLTQNFQIVIVRIFRIVRNIGVL